MWITSLGNSSYISSVDFILCLPVCAWDGCEMSCSKSHGSTCVTWDQALKKALIKSVFFGLNKKDLNNSNAIISKWATLMFVWYKTCFDNPCWTEYPFFRSNLRTFLVCYNMYIYFQIMSLKSIIHFKMLQKAEVIVKAFIFCFCGSQNHKT